jgi:hypothetical protein
MEVRMEWAYECNPKEETVGVDGNPVRYQTGRVWLYMLKAGHMIRGKTGFKPNWVVPQEYTSCPYGDKGYFLLTIF